MVMLATLATVIASQAVISGAFSVTRQAVQLGFLPRLRIRHTSEARDRPGLRPGRQLGALRRRRRARRRLRLVRRRSPSAYGIAVTGTLAIDTILFFVVVRMLWGKPLWMVLVGRRRLPARRPRVLRGQRAQGRRTAAGSRCCSRSCVFVAADDLAAGREIVAANRTEAEGPLREFVDEVQALRPADLPAAGDRRLPQRQQSRPRRWRCATTSSTTTSLHGTWSSSRSRPCRSRTSLAAERLDVDELGYEDDGILHLTVRYGFQDDKNIPAALRQAVEQGLEVDLDVDNATYFISQITIVAGDDPGLSKRRKKLFLALSRTSASPVEFFGLPERRIVTMGSTSSSRRSRLDSESSPLLPPARSPRAA